MTRLRLSDGVDLQVDVPVEQVREALQEALRKATLLEITVGDDSVVINPNQVLYLQAAPSGQGMIELGALNGAPVRLTQVR